MRFGRTTRLAGIIPRNSRGVLPWAAGCIVLGLCNPAWAQKYPGQTIPDAAPARVAPARPAYVPPSVPPSRVPPAGSAGAERDAQARDLAGQLPLAPATANLQSRLPTDVPGTIRQLGLRVPTGGRLDLRNGGASTAEVINALQH